MAVGKIVESVGLPVNIYINNNIATNETRSPSTAAANDYCRWEFANLYIFSFC